MYHFNNFFYNNIILFQSTVRISNSTFIGNVAEDSGGAVYMNLNGKNKSTTDIHFADSEFIENTAVHGGGIEVTFDTSESVHYPNSITIERCYFKGMSIPLMINSHLC